MNRYLTIILLFCVFNGIAQEKKPAPTLQNLQRRHHYMQSRDYKGPKTESYNNPATLEENSSISEENASNSSSGGGTISYSPEKIDQKRKNNGSGGNGGDGFGRGGPKSQDPEMGKPQEIDFDERQIKSEPEERSNSETNPISPMFWKTLFIIILIIAVLFIAYYVIKNYRPRNRNVPANFTPAELNPEEISKSELELRLEAALLREDYRECVRIYFTFILKELIRLRRIRWKKESTNRDYLNQSRSQDSAGNFEQSVKIYDLVWYGEYAIQKKHYDLLEAHLSTYYKQLSTENV